VSKRRIDQLRAIIAGRPAGHPEHELAKAELAKQLEREPPALSPLDKLGAYLSKLDGRGE
jgi:hypothetical protein